MTEQVLKKRIFIFMLIAKALVLLFVVFHWETGGFDKTQTAAAITLIIPLFSVYATVMANEYIKNRYQTKREKGIKLTSTFTTLTYIVFPVYVLSIIGLVQMKATGTFSFSEFQTFLTTIETGLGVYVGQIVFGLFKKETSKTE